MNCENAPMFGGSLSMMDSDAEALFSVGRRFLASLSSKSELEDESKPAVKPVCAHNPAINCPCPKDCPRHGKCCACVAHHREHGKLPACLRDQQ